MRIRRLEVNGFRAFSSSVALDLNADVVILAGENGQGKTSVFDAIHWALTGRLSRLEENGAAVLSMYSPSGEAKVALELANTDGTALKITRSYDGQEQRLTVEKNTSRYQGQKAEVELLEAIWPTALLTANSSFSLDAALTRSVYLQQDVLREFIEADSEQDRFNAVSELIGTGRITELHVQLERAKKSWSAVTNVKREELENLSGELSRLQSTMDKMSDDSDLSISRIEKDWKDWWSSVSSVGVDIESAPSPTAPTAPTLLDTAVRQLDARRRSLSRREEAVGLLLSELSDRDIADAPDTIPLRERLESVDNEIEAKESKLAIAREELIQERKRLRQIRETREELRTLAQIALRHLGDRCPVCTQAYDETITRKHLEELSEADEGQEEPKLFLDKVNTLEEELDTLGKDKSEVERELESVRRRVSEHSEWKEHIRSRAQELEVEGTDDTSLSENLQNAASQASKEQEELQKLQREGEGLASELARIADAARRHELSQEIEELRPKVQALQNQISGRDMTGDLAGDILDGLREAASTVVQAQLEEIEPLLQRIYSRIDPHPAFRTVRLLTRYRYGRGHLMAEVNDPIAHVSSRYPHVILSSSQINALAVSIYLAFNLGMPAIPLESAMLDDPFQSLDDINLIGLVDLLRRFADRRQLLISTHDSRFASLLQRKLRPLSEGRRTITLELHGWSRKGPKVSHRDIPLDREPFKIAA